MVSNLPQLVRQQVVDEIAEIIAEMDLTPSQREIAKAVLRATIRRMNEPKSEAA